MNDELTQEDFTNFQDGIASLIDNLTEIFANLFDAIKQIADAIINFVKTAWRKIVCIIGNGRNRNLVIHGKSYRVRKKNFHIMQKKFLKAMKDGEQM